MRSPSTKQTKTTSRKPYQPAVGREIEVDEVLLVEARTRDFLAKLFAVSTVLAVVVTGVHGLLTGAYHLVEVVWAIAGPIIGAMVAYYFGPQRKDSG
jgi:hypothetical protein